ncbi:type IX secretion system histidine kinase PorY [Parafilimonas sp.]|uniref:sensor histidine kinase n=1 Tax=Parafilimonas sp. TaxID=1969739 RepID=UPI003F808A08
MNRLLNKTLLYYSFFATVILLLSAPFIYWTMEKLYRDDVDEAILLRRDEFETNNRKSLHISDIPVWNQFNRDTRILPDTVKSTPKDSITQQVFYDALVPEWEPYRVLYKDIVIEGKPFVLMIRLNLVESDDLIRTIVWIYIGILFALLLVIFFITGFVSNRLWKPFYDTLHKIEQFNIELHNQPEFSATKVTEFSQLNNRLTKLIQHSLQSYDTQKAFTQNASHELQTPLAIFQSKLDLLLQDNSLRKDQVVVLHSLYESVSRLTRINKNLLLLAKIENKQFAEVSSFTLNDIVKEITPYFTEQAESKKLSITMESDSMVSLNTNKVLTEIMINNLFLNAIRHNIENGKINIKLEANCFSIANTGAGKALDGRTVFDRFKKNSTDARSSGLGLAIAKEICERNNWDIRYRFEAALHIFTIAF